MHAIHIDECYLNNTSTKILHRYQIKVSKFRSLYMLSQMQYIFIEQSSMTSIQIL